MKESMNSEIKVNAEAFAIATQMYVRLRRVSSRVIDVMYLVNNKEYAKHIRLLAKIKKRSTFCLFFIHIKKSCSTIMST